MTSEPHEFARTLRKQMTPAEDILSRRLRGSRFHGAKFRRQVPFDRYVADFYCHAAKLVVDPRTAIRGDGVQHEWLVDYDKGRTEVIENFGVRVVRFANAEVCNDLKSVLIRFARIECPLLKRRRDAHDYRAAQICRTLRKHMTPAEDILWRRLRGSRFHGAKFRRHAPRL